MIIDQIKFIFKYQKRSKRTRTKLVSGFAILFSILLASFLITLGISIFSISLKEIQIITSTRDSQTAYYIADSARECALYWDIKQGYFPTCLSSDCSIVNPQITPIKCNGKDIDLDFDNVGLVYSTLITQDFFQASTTLISAPVADIRITKTFNPATFGVSTKIDAWGHNTGIIGRRVERGISTTNN